MECFDKILLKTLDRTFRSVLGERNTLIIYDYFEKSFCSKEEIPARLDLFSVALRDLLGTDRGQILGAPLILEGAIVEALSSELGLKPDEESKTFKDKVRSLEEKFNNGQGKKA